MSWNYSMDGWPNTTQDVDQLISALVDLYPNVPLTRRLETIQEAAISIAFHEHVIDGVEMETCYDYLLTGKVLTAR